MMAQAAALLREGTRELHRQVEHRLDFLVRRPRLDDYTALLRAFYGYYPAIEAELAAWQAQLPPGFGPEARHKSALLARDLVALGTPADDLARMPRCGELPALPDLAHALGALYVLEGASLGGRIIARSVHASLGLDPARGLAFFHGYGDRVDAMWASFLALLGATCDDPPAIAAAVAAARATFETLDRWLERHGPAPS